LLAVGALMAATSAIASPSNGRSDKTLGIDLSTLHHSLGNRQQRGAGARPSAHVLHLPFLLLGAADRGPSVRGPNRRITFCRLAALATVGGRRWGATSLAGHLVGVVEFPDQAVPSSTPPAAAGRPRPYAAWVRIMAVRSYCEARRPSAQKIRSMKAAESHLTANLGAFSLIAVVRWQASRTVRIGAIRISKRRARESRTDVARTAGNFLEYAIREHIQQVSVAANRPDARPDGHVGAQCSRLAKASRTRSECQRTPLSKKRVLRLALTR